MHNKSQILFIQHTKSHIHFEYNSLKISHEFILNTVFCVIPLSLHLFILFGDDDVGNDNRSHFSRENPLFIIIYHAEGVHNFHVTLRIWFCLIFFFNFNFFLIMSFKLREVSNSIFLLFRVKKKLKQPQQTSYFYFRLA